MAWWVVVWADAAWAANPHGTEGQDWYVPLGVVIIGMVVGFVLISRQTEADARIDEEAREIDLGATRDEVVEALRQLEVEKSKMDPGQYETERQQLLARGAKAMRELDDEAPEDDGVVAPKAAAASSAEPTPAEGPLGIWNALAPEWRGAITALTVVAVIAGFIFMAQNDSRVRREGESITGSDIVTNNNARPQGLEKADPQVVAMIEALETQLKEDPQDVQVLNQLTQLYLSANVPAQAMNYNTEVRKIDPKDKDGLAYLGVLRMMMGMGEKALEPLDEVLAEDGNHLLSLVYKGLIEIELGRYDSAVTQLEKAMTLAPGNPMITQALADAKRFASGDTPVPGGKGGELIVRGTMDLDPSVKGSLKGNEVVFLSVKDPSQAGPPVAAIKLPASFPAPFSITTADIRAMAGNTTVPAQLSLTVRVDLDGNAMTKEKAPIAVVTGIAKGASGVSAILSLDGAPTEAPSVAAASAAAAGDTIVSGTATLAPGKDANGVVFISARPIAGGPPVAAKRIPGASFPLRFSLTKADVIPMMAGRPLPDEIILKVHVDRDGNVTTQEDGPTAVLASVKRGTTGVELQLE